MRSISLSFSFYYRGVYGNAVAKKKRSGWDEKELFWPYQQARTPLTRDMKWAAMMRKLPPEAFAHLRDQKAKEERENGNTWTALKHIETGMCMFDRCGANNPVEQLHARQVKHRGGNPAVRGVGESRNSKAHLLQRLANSRRTVIFSPHGRTKCSNAVWVKWRR